MNRVFKTKWSTAHQQYVVTDEHHATKGKASKSAVALAVAALMMAAGAASAAFVQPSHTYDNVNWRNDAEYMKDWGLRAMNADHAYTLGFYGQGVTLGIVDSGTLLTHSQLEGQLIDTAITGNYGSSGHRYQPWSNLNWGNNDHNNQFGQYEKGQSFDRESSNWAAYVNDSHGTHVAGTIVGKRDGTEFHGVSFGSQLVVGNTGGTDNSTYGPILLDPKKPGDYKSYSVLDYNYFKAVYSSVAASGAKFINNSWGTNTRVNVMGAGNFIDDSATYINFNVSDAWVTEVQAKLPELDENGKVKRDENKKVIYQDNGALKTVTLDVPGGYIGEWWLYQQSANANQGGKAFIDAAGEVALDKKIVQVFTTGNRNEDNPYVRAGYAHFKPEFERNWVAVAGAKYINEELYYISNFNDAGYGKWWTVAAPGNAIYSSAVVDDAYVTPGVKEGEGKVLGDETFASWGGTSMAAPHVTGALGVLASRYPYMEPTQVRDTMFTTANQDIKFEIKTSEGTENTDGTHDRDESYGNGTDKKGSFFEGVPDVNFGWGVPDLKKGMYGPGQLLGKTDINLGSYSDIWSNDISQIAWDARRLEDKAELKTANAELQKIATLAQDSEEYKAKKAYYDLRIKALTERLGNLDKKDDDKWYVGTLTVKGDKGSGATLLLTGDNTFRGGVEVLEGATVMGFDESFGSYDPTYALVDDGYSNAQDGGARYADDNATAQLNNLKKVDGQLTIAAGGRGGILAHAYDEVTDKGQIKPSIEAQHTTKVIVKNGGTLLVHGAGNTTVKSVDVEQGALVSGWAQGKDLAKIYDEGTLKGKLTVTDGSLSALKAAEDDLLFFNAKTTVAQDSKSVSTEIVRDETKNFGMFAKNENQKSIAAGLEGKKGELFEALLSGNQAMFDSTLDTLDNDLLLNAQNAAIVNTMDITKAVKDQALRRGEGNFVELAHGAHLWATGVGSWGSAENTSDVDVDFYAGLFGIDYQLGNTTLGAFFGAGTTEFKGGVDGKLDSDDIHLGIYGKTDIAEMASISYGLTHTMQDREGNRTVNLANNLGYSAFNTDADITQFYVEGAYTGFKFQNGTTVEPYVGFSYIHASADGVSDTAGGMTYTTDIEDQNVQATTLGVRGKIPFAVGAAQVALKGDMAWSHFFGDTTAEGRLGGVAGGVIEGAELSDMFSIGLGVEATVGKNTTFGLSYTGNFDSDVKSNGISANVRYAF